jgi:hypothetical protein
MRASRPKRGPGAQCGGRFVPRRLRDGGSQGSEIGILAYYRRSVADRVEASWTWYRSANILAAPASWPAGEPSQHFIPDKPIGLVTKKESGSRR